ncbi:hypothetical protein GQ53DRAFT_456021 [Thozetella sp. PMI_491]|nr:hypothetical protein GQ53DRAFT_456021 [Thozetella sp. PMI_491]
MGTTAGLSHYSSEEGETRDGWMYSRRKGGEEGSPCSNAGAPLEHSTSGFFFLHLRLDIHTGAVALLAWEETLSFGSACGPPRPCSRSRPTLYHIQPDVHEGPIARRPIFGVERRRERVSGTHPALGPSLIRPHPARRAGPDTESRSVVARCDSPVAILGRGVCALGKAPWGLGKREIQMKGISGALALLRR